MQASKSVKGHLSNSDLSTFVYNAMPSGCTYHTNVGYIRKACNDLFIKNGREVPFPDNETLVLSALCSRNSIKCIMRICQTYKSFPKINALDI